MQQFPEALEVLAAKEPCLGGCTSRYHTILAEHVLKGNDFGQVSLRRPAEYGNAHFVQLP